MMNDNFYEEDDKRGAKGGNKENLTIQNIMKNESGREFIMSHLQSCGVFESIWDVDPAKHAYNAGKREAGLRLKRSIEEAAPGYYIKMIEESIDG